MKAMFDALNIVHDEKEQRGFFRLNAISLAFTILGLVFALIAVAAVVLLPILLSYVGFQSTGQQALQFGRWPLLLVGIALALAVIYRFGPDRQHAKWRWITWGSATAALLWLAASALFSWYVANFGSFNQTYGTLGERNAALEAAIIALAEQPVLVFRFGFLFVLICESAIRELDLDIPPSA